MTLTDYYTKICELIGEIEIIQPVCNCVCDAQQSMLTKIDQDNMILFVNGLNNRYATVRNQILFIDPLPTMSKTYSLVLQIEQQNEAYHAIELSVCVADNKKLDATKKNFDKKKAQAEKQNMICEFYKKKGHGWDICFKLHGVPNWFKEITTKKNQSCPPMLPARMQSEEINIQP